MFVCETAVIYLYSVTLFAIELKYLAYVTIHKNIQFYTLSPCAEPTLIVIFNFSVRYETTSDGITV
jgi:hypothetical protein